MIVMRSSPLRAKRAKPPEVVLLPGSGSDEVFLETAFGGPLRALGMTVVTPPTRSGATVVDGYLDALQRAARPGVRLVVGGVSLGAQVAARWASDRLARGATDIAGLLLTLPAWTGPPDRAPAALAAAASAVALRRDGLTATLEEIRAGAPGWLADELTRAWTRHGPGLAESLSATAAAEGPTDTELAALRVPVGLVGLTDDPLHPVGVAYHWHSVLPRSALVTSTLDALGRDRASLGRAATLAWLRATHSPVDR
jgi:pimeloyl-ACP methyl ester carboxylesterase